MWGSSPRGRGKLQSECADGCLAGLIPAWAGKTRRGGEHPRHGGAHPRVGGENAVLGATGTGADGSSPRGRGKHRLHHVEPLPEGLIPAWAGKTRPRASSQACSGAHPRVGGENAGFGRVSPWSSGSSPRGRGKRDRLTDRTAHEGLIPAWAGKTHSRRCGPDRRPAHPRVGGENPLGGPVVNHDVGSSPRGRGKRRMGHESIQTTGLIPAWAGKTPGPGRCGGRTPAHPRVGGENIGLNAGWERLEGSSPRGRGKRIRRCADAE